MVQAMNSNPDYSVYSFDAHIYAAVVSGRL